MVEVATITTTPAARVNGEVEDGDIDAMAGALMAPSKSGKRQCKQRQSNMKQAAGNLDFFAFAMMRSVSHLRRLYAAGGLVRRGRAAHDETGTRAAEWGVIEDTVFLGGRKVETSHDAFAEERPCFGIDFDLNKK
ncbi:hypothetical protein TcBrA4_0034860 [Trypanosoma cruzi]|nr:hypothetical protein TcBrA4_0034860 [Trypanosoma cruzi]